MIWWSWGPHPVPVFNEVAQFLVGAHFWVGARLDITTPMHFAMGIVAFLLHYLAFRHPERARLFAISFGTGVEWANASGDQGFDLLDITATIAGALVIYALKRR